MITFIQQHFIPYNFYTKNDMAYYNLIGYIEDGKIFFTDEENNIYKDVLLDHQDYLTSEKMIKTFEYFAQFTEPILTMYITTFINNGLRKHLVVDYDLFDGKQYIYAADFLIYAHFNKFYDESRIRYNMRPDVPSFPMNGSLGTGVTANTRSFSNTTEVLFKMEPIFTIDYDNDKIEFQKNMISGEEDEIERINIILMKLYNKVPWFFTKIIDGESTCYKPVRLL